MRTLGSQFTAGSSLLDRRRFLTTTALGGAALVSPRLVPAAADEAEPVAFVLIGDTHYLAAKESPDALDPQSAVTTSRLVETINRLPGLAITAEAGGGEVAALRGVIHAGDVIDTGDKTGRVQRQMQETEWRGFVADFGLTGSDGRLKFPVYEVHGNHDGPSGTGLAIDGIKERNRQRPGIKNVSPGGLHYAWDWGPVHFINLGIVVGQTPESTQRRRYNPLGSLDFLIDDLRTHVGTSGRPVVITHHIDVQRYSLACDPSDPANEGREWNPCDARAYHRALQGYNVVAILYGHTHARNLLKWNGTASRADTGYDLFNVDNSAHFHSDAQALFYFEIGRDSLVVRELATTDRWQTAHWTPQAWQRKISQPS